MNKAVVNIQKLLIQFLLLMCVLCSCQEKKIRVSVTLDSFADVADKKYAIDAELLGENIYRLIMADRERETADIHARRHYLDGGPLVWLTRNGVSSKADSVLAYVGRMDSVGFSRERFYYSLISADLRRARNIDFDEAIDSDNNINKVYARLEYYLTKAFLRYAEGERFGYVNPYDAFNRLDVRDSDSVRVLYRSLYDVPTKRADKDFVAESFRVMAGSDASVGEFLRESMPENPLFYVFARQLKTTTLLTERRRLLCNMERSRWRHGDYPQKYKKYVVVNVPSLHLQAVDGDEWLTMRIGLGSLKTKTPLLTSRVKRMDFNPQWIIPKSIVKTSVRNHAGNRAYFESRDYFVQQRSTGREVDPAEVTADMLMSHDYLVIHGCIRVEKPYELAVFMLNDKDEQLMEKMRYSMTVKYGRHRTGDDDQNDPIKQNMMLRSLKVEPQVPIFITYYTLYPDKSGKLVAYNDIYGFDPVIYSRLQKYF